MFSLTLHNDVVNHQSEKDFTCSIRIYPALKRLMMVCIWYRYQYLIQDAALHIQQILS